MSSIEGQNHLIVVGKPDENNWFAYHALFTESNSDLTQDCVTEDFMSPGPTGFVNHPFDRRGKILVFGNGPFVSVVAYDLVKNFVDNYSHSSWSYADKVMERGIRYKAGNSLRISAAIKRDCSRAILSVYDPQNNSKSETGFYDIYPGRGYALATKGYESANGWRLFQKPVSIPIEGEFACWMDLLWEASDPSHRVALSGIRLDSHTGDIRQRTIWQNKTVYRQSLLFW